ncbi:MAG: CoA pyrophosphatase [Clostridiales Family XIII bacterium]|nr:CoA pyrophosphatase [Clostridiales Family XIII bacterium]
MKQKPERPDDRDAAAKRALSSPSLAQIRESLCDLTPKPIGKYRYYSVLIPLVERDGELNILYEVRSDNLRHQPGEIGFPGGKIEAGETPRDCAARETCEELCIRPNAVELIGPLNYIVTYSDFTMYAFLGRIEADALSRAKPNPQEVKRLFEVPLRFFLENEPDVYINELRPSIAKDFPLDKIHFKEGYSWRTGEATVPIYTYRDAITGEEFVIWGLTARLTQDFIQLIR